MPTSLVLTCIGPDKPGLVHALAAAVVLAGGNWVESRLAHLAGEFAGIVRVNVPEANAKGLAAALRALEGQGLRVTVAESEEFPRAKDLKTISISLVAHDRPGIVRDVTEALLRLGVSVEEFASSVESAPFTGEEMFRLTARLAVPENVGSELVRRALERLHAEIMVDLEVSEAPAPA